uniref:ShKT domain-containing protein n=1 Tax=Parastrongyloides trichosuri TaxID=131310 RepID=A0A0N4ZDT7_PARTI
MSSRSFLLILITLSLAIIIKATPFDVCTDSTGCASTEACITLNSVGYCVALCVTANVATQCGATETACATASANSDPAGASICPAMEALQVAGTTDPTCLADTTCAALDPTMPICNTYTFTCEADTTTTTTEVTTTTEDTTTTDASTTTEDTTTTDVSTTTEDTTTTVAETTTSESITTTLDTTTTTIAAVVTTTESPASTNVPTTTPCGSQTGQSSNTPKCEDKVVGGNNDCESLSAYCTNPIYLDMMKDKCPKTCNYCQDLSSNNQSGNCNGGTNENTNNGNCEDKIVGGVNDCPSLAAYCTNDLYLDLMKEKCPRTCNYCSGSSTNSGSGTSSNGVTCKDILKDCSRKSYLCKLSAYKDLMKTNCARSCGFC